MKVWLITGCSSGFGLCIAQEALARGERVIATARKITDLHEHFLTSSNLLLLKQLDITNSSEMNSVVSEAVAEFGQIDVLVNNAACGLVGSLEESSEDEIRRVFETNLMGTIAMTRCVLPIMRQQASGHIINMSAIAGLYNEMGFSIYGASKFAIEGVSESLRAEVAPFGIKVTLIEPGPFRTPFIKKSIVSVSNKIDDYKRTSGKFAKMLSSLDGKQPGDPEAAAKAICDIANLDKPPFRLILGKYAYDRLNLKIKQMTEELEANKELTFSTEFQGSS